jgi:hypothetical protein
MPTETAMSPRSICAAMNWLIRACVDDASAQANAAAIARDEAYLRKKSFLR